MCIAFPGKIISIEDNRAVIDIEGTRRETFLDLIDEKVTIGDYVICHAGFASTRWTRSLHGRSSRCSESSPIMKFIDEYRTRNCLTDCSQVSGDGPEDCPDPLQSWRSAGATPAPSAVSGYGACSPKTSGLSRVPGVRFV